MMPLNISSGSQRKKSQTRSDSSSVAERKRKLSRQLSRQKSVEEQQKKINTNEEDASKLIKEEKAETGNVQYIFSCYQC